MTSEAALTPVCDSHVTAFAVSQMNDCTVLRSIYSSDLRFPMIKTKSSPYKYSILNEKEFFIGYFYSFLFFT